MRWSLVVVAVVAVVFAACAQPHVPEPPDATELDRAVIEELEGDGVPGLQAAVLRDGAIVFEGAWGLADTETGRRVDGDTLFTIASVSKIVTTVAVLRAVEAGVVTLDEPIDLGFPVAHPKGGAPVTLRQLLTHTSGIVDNWDVMEPLYTDGDPVISLRAFLRGYLEPGGAYYDADKNWAAWTPNEGYDYSNIGIAVAALAVEEATGEDFASYCQESIFDPLGMDATSWYLAGVDVDRLAVPTLWRRGWDPVGHVGWPDYPNGSLRTSASQLAAFLIAVFDGDLLAADTVDEMLRVQVPELEGTQGLGFYWWTLDGVDVVGHNGGEVGISSEALVRPSRDDGVVLLANGELGEGAFRRIERALLE